MFLASDVQSQTFYTIFDLFKFLTLKKQKTKIHARDKLNTVYGFHY